MNPTSPFANPAKDVLDADTSLNNDQRADLHDAFYSKNADELVQHLTPMDIPVETKDGLHQAKLAMVPPVDKVSEAVKRIAQLDPETRQIAETSPNLLKAFTTAATADTKAASKPAEKTSSPAKGKTASKAETEPTVVPDVPPTPSGHALVLASDHGVHHIPVDRLDEAKTIDPALKILHVEP